jgi:hypothetical protein
VQGHEVVQLDDCDDPASSTVRAARSNMSECPQRSTRVGHAEIAYSSCTCGSLTIDSVVDDLRLVAFLHEDDSGANANVRKSDCVIASHHAQESLQ